ncbi:uncharacterized protein LOC110702289 [Chenopodium quinoa]|uniref:uncharacterized protein LOC110702289 n=1 Tax=Chenopodium quinoa TaxID=63459 RepID=UPI000B7882FC|nr:uncharacterized protein LOC110702289 [Chenopodium quinoa]
MDVFKIESRLRMSMETYMTVDFYKQPAFDHPLLANHSFHPEVQDPKDGNWWLTFGDENIVQGFWPKEIFTGLSMLATKVSFGGEAYGPADQPLPPMGNGYLGIADLEYAAYCRSIVVLDENLKADNDPHEIETYTDDSHYRVIDCGWTNRFGRIMFYGGTIPQ